MIDALKGETIHPRIQVEDGGEIHFAVSCRHCTEPLCVKGCISGALTIEEGVIRLKEEKCVGCYTCVLSCPYGAIMPGEGKAVQKCELCLNNTHGTPLCVQGCPNRAIVFEER